VFKNRRLWRIFGPEREEVSVGWKRLHNEELHNLYISLSFVWMIKLKKMKWAGHVARMGSMRNSYRILVGKLEG
jgi:hypothetical protein